MKECFKCNQVKPLTDFYKHPKMTDGHVNKCKDCYKNDVKGNYLINKQDANYIEKERKRGRKKYHRLYTGTNKANPISVKRWQEKYPEKRIASSKCSSLKKPFENAEKHHWSYNEEHYKDVIWITKKHHMKGHRFIIYDQEQMMYRRFDTNELLNTKERHQQFIEWCIQNKED